jgi:hypothetical protein
VLTLFIWRELGEKPTPPKIQGLEALKPPRDKTRDIQQSPSCCGLHGIVVRSSLTDTF